jgi:hypothetical protein
MSVNVIMELKLVGQVRCGLRPLGGKPIASAGDTALRGVDHEAGALQDFRERGTNLPDRAVVKVEVQPAVAWETEGRGSLWTKFEGEVVVDGSGRPVLSKLSRCC